MFTSIFRWRVGDALQSLADHAENGLVPVLRECPGFVAYYVVDAGDGEAVTICVFESRETELASREKALAYERTREGAAMPELLEIKAGEIVVSAYRAPD